MSGRAGLFCFPHPLPVSRSAFFVWFAAVTAASRKLTHAWEEQRQKALHKVRAGAAMLRVWRLEVCAAVNLGLTQPSPQAETAADSRMRHRFAVNEAVNEQKKEEARQLLWLHQNWDKIDPDGTGGGPPEGTEDMDLDKARELVERDEISAEVSGARKEVNKEFKRLRRQKDRIEAYALGLARKTEAKIRRQCGLVMLRRHRLQDERDGVRLPKVKVAAQVRTKLSGRRKSHGTPVLPKLS